MPDKIVTRIAPSPTGRMHIGTARTALFNYLWARHVGGKFLIRIEDTDPARDKPEYEKDILDNLAWLGIHGDEFHRQSENKALHAEMIAKLIDVDKAYVSKEPAKDDATRTVEVVRFRNPNVLVTFRDELRGEVSVHTADLGDFVIARSLTEPVHHLAVVVDDATAGVTLAMRGEDLLSNTPRQILIQDALGLPRPQYLHLPLILAPDRTKLSKRRHATSLGDFRERGFLASGLANFLAFLGWNPGTEQDIFTMDELIAAFDLKQIQKSPAIFDEVKLKWVNREHILHMPESDFATMVTSFISPESAASVKKTPALASVMRERASTFGEIREADLAGEYAYFYKTPTVQADALIYKTESKEATVARLSHVLKLLESTRGVWTKEAIKEALWPYAEAEGRGQVLWPLRMALSGREKSPDPFTISGIIGYDETKYRIDGAVIVLRS
ncbi:MAG: glutamate--tRNA ligase family protein [Patescibacteria group bacterium]